MNTISQRNNEIYTINKVVGITLLIFSLFLGSVSSNYYFLGLLLSISVFLFTSGVEFDSTKRRYRKYKSIAGLRRGTWKDIPTNACLVVLEKHGKKTSTGGKGAQEIDVKSLFYELFMMNSSHTQRFYIHSSESKEEVDVLASEFCSKTNMSVEKYCPVRP